jgi:hypothetical protein
MTELVRIVDVQTILHGVLKLQWDDGYEGLVDLRPILEEGGVFAFLHDDPSAFAGVMLDSSRHRIYWVDPDGDEIDFGADSLRLRAERQAALLKLAS